MKNKPTAKDDIKASQMTTKILTNVKFNGIERGKMTKIVIYKNILALLVPVLLLLPMLFTFPFLLLSIIVGKSWIAIVPALILLMLMILGLMNTVTLFRFGRKKIVLDEESIHYFWVVERKVYWKEVKDIKREMIGSVDNCRIITEKESVNVQLEDTELSYSTDEIYDKIVEFWVKEN